MTSEERPTRAEKTFPVHVTQAEADIVVELLTAELADAAEDRNKDAIAVLSALIRRFDEAGREAARVGG